VSAWIQDERGGFSNFVKPKGAYDHHVDDRRWVLRGILRKPSRKYRHVIKFESANY
jgi:hypothetical protein